MRRTFKTLLIFLFVGCANTGIERGEIGIILMEEPEFKEAQKERMLYKDTGYILHARGCGLGAQFSSTAATMVKAYNNSVKDDRAIGVADIHYEATFEWYLMPCLKVWGTPVVEKPKKVNDFVPVDLNYIP